MENINENAINKTTEEVVTTAPEEEVSQDTTAEVPAEETAETPVEPMIMSSKDMMEISESIEEAKNQIEGISSITISLLEAKYECSEEDSVRFFDKMRNLVMNGRSNDYTSDEKNDFFRDDDGTDYTNEEALEHLDDINTMDEYREAIFDDLFDSANEEKEQIENLKSIEKDFNEKKEAQIKYLNSPEYKEKKEKSYRELEKRYNEETDPVAKAALKKSYDFLTSLRTFDYLFTRIANNPNEVKNILDAFLDNSRTRYVMKRYFSKFEQLRKVKKFAVDPQSILYFMHTECQMLPEKYHVMDGFFIFNVINYIAYIDVYSDHDLMFVQNILLNLKKLFYHEFVDIEDEKKFVKVITDFEDKFDAYSEKFAAENDVYRNYMESLKKEGEENLEEPAEDSVDESETAPSAHTITSPKGVTYEISKSVDEKGGFKLFVDGFPVIKPSELNPPSPSICYAKSYTGEDGNEEVEVIDTGIPIDEFRAKLEEYGI